MAFKHIIHKESEAEEYDGTLWFFTRRSAEKVFETESDHNVCISFSDQKEGTYVSLSGKANIKKDATPNMGENEKFSG